MKKSLSLILALMVSLLSFSFAFAAEDIVIGISMPSLQSSFFEGSMVK